MFSCYLSMLVAMLVAMTYLILDELNLGMLVGMEEVFHLGEFGQVVFSAGTTNTETNQTLASILFLCGSKLKFIYLN